MDFVVIQFLNGLASASSLFLVASGLSIIFGVSRIVNFAHGSLYMLGAYLAYTLIDRFPATPFGFWGGAAVAALTVALFGLLLETVLLRRIYTAPELLQLLATFGVTLVVQDLVLLIWGPEDLLGPRAPGLTGAVDILGHPFPTYELFLILLGPVVLAALWLLFRTTRWGVLVRAATQDREMVSALGVDQSRLFTSVFVLGAFLAGLGGALQIPREAVHHAMDLQIIVEAFVVVVIGGLGSVPGAFLAAVLIGELNAFGILVFPQLTLVMTFLAMAVVLVIRPWGLLGRPEVAVRASAAETPPPMRPSAGLGRMIIPAVLAALVALPAVAGDYATIIATETLIFALFAASLQFLTGTGGMISFGHAAYFGLGAYGAALLTRHLAWPMEWALPAGPVLAVMGAAVFGWFCVRLSGVYLAMLTLAFAQIAWSVIFQWYGFTGGDNGILGVWPAPWASAPATYYYLTLAVTALCLLLIRRVAFAPFGFGLRAIRDSALRADAIGIHVTRHRWLGFMLAGLFAGVAGSLYAFLKGNVFPGVLAIPVSVDGLVMMLLGGVRTLAGALIGAGVYRSLYVTMSSYVDLWRLILGVIIITLVVVFPRGIVGHLAPLLRSRRTEDTEVRT